MIDLSSQFGVRVVARLDQELIVWLTTVRADGTPQPLPVWFLWVDQTVLIYGQPNTQKLRNIAQNANVALNFNSDEYGDNVGNNRYGADRSSCAVGRSDQRLRGKIRSGIASFGSDAEGFAQSYSVAIRVTPTSVRGY
jgi:PPOX class probable F420-dependent enzyme